ncbi:MAG: polysaccharide deacetylase [Clostridiales bacterium]|uniref:polysaccharide deacetylase family protein n=1 Tax=Terrisporobacter sp. TaxID=1965305 RepID=UPI002A5068BE|nr:polysaccharide deacetylase family protein [Terrisporobacter sp.]MDD7756027.1 polysaccharide deacetylase [Clostridiales bacterium]MDY4135439.1 polysaccharide deacetylase family protein [Terrisporobacter sp.]
MNENELNLKDKLRDFYEHKKKETFLIGGSILLILSILLVSIVKINSKEVLAFAKSRNAALEGETITSMVYSGAEEMQKGPSKTYGKVVYLTIDDGPSEYTDEIIKILNKNNVKATFFMINGNMQAYPEQVKNIVKNGNTAGFHSVSHDIHKLYVSKTSAKEEFDTNQATFKKITGQTSKVIRLPFGSKPYTPRASYNALVDSGYKLWDWTLDTEDWRSTSSQIMENVKKYSSGSDNVVLLMHERKQTVEILDEMIKYLKSEGFEILPIKQSDEARNYWNGKLFSEEN